LFFISLACSLNLVSNVCPICPIYACVDIHQIVTGIFNLNCICQWYFSLF
jgi:hypothetical protein